MVRMVNAGGEQGAGGEEFPAFLDRRAIFIDTGDGDIKQRNDHHPAEGPEEQMGVVAADVELAEPGSEQLRLRDQDDHGADDHTKHKGSEFDGHPAGRQRVSPGVIDKGLVETNA